MWDFFTRPVRTRSTEDGSTQGSRSSTVQGETPPGTAFSGSPSSFNQGFLRASQNKLFHLLAPTVNFKDVTLTPSVSGMQVKLSGRKTSLDLQNSKDNLPDITQLPRLGVQKNKLVIIMVGLPGRGKTFLCNKLKRYLNWLGHNTQHFNVGNYRRKNKGNEEQDASFFDQKNEAGARARQEALLLALDDLMEWLKSGVGQVAILDGTNSTNERRNFLRSQFHGRWQYLFIESICSDEEVLNSNYRAKMRYSPDYKGMDEEKAVMDFRKRISNYEEVYEPITDRNLHYIKLIDMITGRAHLDINRISGYIPGKMVFYLMQVCKAGGTGESCGKAVMDFRKRISNYEEVYEPITDRNLHYIKLIDMITGRAHLDINRISGYIPGKMVFYLMQVCKAGGTARKLWLTRHGQSEFNMGDRLGGDSSISAAGDRYASLLPAALLSRLPPDGVISLSVWTSTLKRTIETARKLPFPKLQWKALDEINAGTCDGMTYSEIAKTMPEEFAARKKDKLRYRYPAGESYMDVIQRTEPVITEMERERESVLIVAHQAVLRALYGYFQGIPLDQVPSLEIPLHTLIELTPMPDGTMHEARLSVDVDASEAQFMHQPPPHADGLPLQPSYTTSQTVA
eukprot:CAMPEP_0202422814 /NCGR_PEP_ID=MMETSP1128-20130828/51054_1 /ASSEMBLY_ACC=CAM_ASM_000463 /TAXON_ID=3047 /ORGANISM="Dunaliella tertiolecta, Strain CCMP1320" /LENGTH=624 /DNA_ID=CAMNT_0049030891 /DNA_START=25 /DNA_END=1900 /DNA_ORIENTATION=-